MIKFVTPPPLIYIKGEIAATVGGTGVVGGTAGTAMYLNRNNDQVQAPNLSQNTTTNDDNHGFDLGTGLAIGLPTATAAYYLWKKNK